MNRLCLGSAALQSGSLEPQPFEDVCQGHRVPNDAVAFRRHSERSVPTVFPFPAIAIFDRRVGTRRRRTSLRSTSQGPGSCIAGISPALLLLPCALMLFCCLLFAGTARAAGRAECRTVASKILGRSVPYCVLLPPSYDSEKNRRYPVLYFLHGLGENEQILLNSGGWDLIQDLWDQKRIGEFLIATPAADRSFYINSRDGRVRYEDFFIKEFLPFIESHYRIRADRAHRGITGVSMGGYGALRLAFRYPQLFGSVSAHSPALIENLPHIQMPGTQENAVSLALGGAFGNPFDPAFWKRNSPFTIVRDSPRPVGMHIYFDCGTEDDYGFNAGAQAFHELLASRGIPHEFHLYPGGHNEVYFAQHLPASLEFQSRAFGLSPGK